ncbi:MAG: prepilin-type N-terminal cleavage/methylation domain-containing protein [Planctomycetota bacterium]
MDSGPVRLSRRGFTLIELLVVIAIIALLIGILLPALGRARDSAKTALCLANQRQIVLALTTYAGDFNGKYPINVFAGTSGNETLPDGTDRWAWFDKEVIGQYLPNTDTADRGAFTENNQRSTVGGGVMVDPNHPQGGRSFAMNYWASSASFYSRAGQTSFSGQPRFLKPGFPGLGEELGAAFDSSVDFASDVMLLGPAWANFSGEDDEGVRWFTQETIGANLLPGERFGFEDNMDVPGLFGDWRTNSSPEIESPDVVVKSYLPYYRHPLRRDNFQALEGKALIGFVDGSVRGFDQESLVDLTENRRRSSYEVLWSPLDARKERQAGL